MATSLQRLDGKDADIKTSAIEDGILTVRTLCYELTEKGQRSVTNFAVKAERNELFMRGEQYRDIDRFSARITDFPWDDTVPRITHNLLRNLVLTWCQRILKDRPSVTAYPSSSEPSDLGAAKAAAALIEYFEFENGVDAKLFDILETACADGIGGIKVYYDPVSEEVKWDVVSIFDFYIDNTENAEDANWVVFKRHIDVYEAKALLKPLGVTDVEASEYKVNDLESREGVETFEIWYKPDDRIPKGIYALIVDGNVVEQMDYPYVFPYLENPESEQTRALLPISLFKVTFIRGTVYGDTWMNDAVPIQRQINEIESVLTKLRRDTGSVKLIAPGTVVDTWDTADSMVKIDDPQKAQIVKWLDPPKINSILFEDRDRLERRLYDIAGLNEVLTGAQSAKAGTSAKQIAYLSELDNMKMAGTARNIEKFIITLFRTTLHLVRNYYVYPRIVRLVGENNAISSMYFMGSDIDGVDVRLEPRAGAERYSAQQAANVIERAEGGLEDPATVMERSRTGLEETSGQTELKGKLIGQADAAMSGQPQQPMPDVNPAYASQVLNEYMGALQTQIPPEQIAIIFELKQMYDQLAAQQAQQAQMAQQQQGQPPQQPQQPLPQGPVL
ncbi:MAG: hypothetical protein Unbinned4336contig1001_10 [Prokaryotic dsDNA virus sp.]|nr:MAG: hypothetical protein Unbinned4336contig1001_10 [Prokaryotic dsDNA virus sp.]|tara:strand:- start:3552 stop:5402 length:1851 start_codon:yes stop_codon:yes gene_type:complete